MDLTRNYGHSLFFWFSVYLFLPILPYFYHQIGLSNQQIGLLIGAFSLGAILFRFISGRAADFIGCNYISLLGLIISLVSIFLYFCTNNWLLLLMSRFTHGAGSALYSSAAITMVTLTNKNEDIKEAISLYTLFSMMGIAISTGSALLIYNHSDINSVILIGISFTILSLVFFPRNSKVKIIKAVTNNSNTDVIKNVILNHNIYRPTINQFFIYFGYSTIIILLPIITSSNSQNYFWLFYAISIAFSRLLVKQITNILSNNTSSILILLSLSISLLLSALIRSVSILPIIGILTGLSVGLAAPTFVAIITTHSSTSNRGSSMGFFSTAIDLGMGLGSVFVGLMASHFSYKFIFLSLCIISTMNIVSFILYLLQGTTKKLAI